jgi:Kef-type K+ transport system membrane component KefB
MKKVWIFSALLTAGLVLSQALPPILGEQTDTVRTAIAFLTMVGLAFIMIHVGYEFDLDKRNLRELGWDYVVAMTAATFPWLLVTGYALLVLMPPRAWATYEGWTEALLTSRFAAPTSAGILFSMLAAAGLSATWTFRKARVLAIFDDLDTILLMIPLTMLIVGLAWQMGLMVLVMVGILYAAWRWLNRLVLPFTWPWVLGYAVTIALLSESIHWGNLAIDRSVPIHLEVLLPAFALGCLMKPLNTPHADDSREGHQEGPEHPQEQIVSTIVSGAFMLLVGLSMPPILGSSTESHAAPAALSARAPLPGWPMMVVHVLVVTVLSNLGKMFPALCYRRQARRRERLALAVSMWPRGEVGAGILVIALAYGLGGPLVAVALLSLALNLLLTGASILIVKRLLAGSGSTRATEETRETAPANEAAGPGAAIHRRG